MTKKYLAHLALLTATIIYGLTYHIAKGVMPGALSSETFVWLRIWFSAFTFISIGFFIHKVPIDKKDYLRFFACAFFGIFTNQLLFFKGLVYTSPVSASVVMTSVPILVVILAYFLLKEPITKNRVLGVITGIIGAIIMILSGGQHHTLSAPNPLLGNLLIFTNASSYAVYLVLVKPLMKKYTAIQVLKWITLIAGCLVLPFGLFGEQSIFNAHWQSFSPTIYYKILFVLVFTSVLTYLLNLVAMRSLKPATVSIYIYGQPLFAALFSVFFVSNYETFSAEKIAATVLIFTGVYLVSKSRKKAVAT